MKKLSLIALRDLPAVSGALRAVIGDLVLGSLRRREDPALHVVDVGCAHQIQVQLGLLLNAVFILERTTLLDLQLALLLQHGLSEWGLVLLLPLL